MNINDIIINGIQEFLYFDIWEAFLMVLLITIMLNIKISKGQYIFHTIMIGVLDLLIFNLTLIPVIQQIIGILVYAMYFFFVLRINFIKSMIKTTEVFFIFFVLEIILTIIYKGIFNVQLISYSNNFIKFEYMIPFRVVEFIFVYIYYKFRNKKNKRGEKYETIKKNIE